MYTKHKIIIILLVLLAGILQACSHPLKFVAPEIDPPSDLIPGYLPEGYTLKSGFQLPGEGVKRAGSDGDDVISFARMLEFNLKSPSGNVIQGVYYRGKEHLILISKSYFPEGNLDHWWAAYEASQFKPCECECVDLRLDAIPLPPRLYEILEERTIHGTQVAIVKGPVDEITTVFVRGDYLLTVESGISLEENLKIVASLLED